MQKNPSIAKVALITGAARRIGARIAHTLHEAGMNIILHYHASEEAAIQVSGELNQQRPGSAVTIRVNLNEDESAKTLVQYAMDTWGRLDALINNASRFYRTAMGQVTEQAWNDLMNSNVKAPFFLAQAAAPLLAVSEGVIVNITDIHAERPLRDYAAYCIAKSALLMATKVLAKELGPRIRVNAVAPGSIVWPEGDNQLSEAEKQNIMARAVLQRAGRPEDIAKAVLYFVRDADYVTGQVLAVDGGRFL